MVCRPAIGIEILNKGEIGMENGYLIVIAKDAKTVVEIDGAYASNYPMADLEDISQHWIEKNQPNHSKKLRSYICKIIHTYKEPRGYLNDYTKTENYLDLDLVALNLNTRSHNALINAKNYVSYGFGRDIKTVGDVVNLSEAELLRLPNLGRKSLNDIKLKFKLLKNKLEKLG